MRSSTWGLFASLILTLQTVVATHFAYGTQYWVNRRDDKNVVTNIVDLSVEYAFRASFFTERGYAFPQAGDLNYAIPNERVYLFQNNGNDPNQGGNYAQRTSWAVQLDVDASYAGPDWFIGTQTFAYDFRSATNSLFILYFQSGNRLSTLVNNADDEWLLINTINVGTSAQPRSAGPRVTGLPRVYFEYAQPVDFQVVANPADGRAVSYSPTATGGLFRSDLGRAEPEAGMLGSDGIMTWTPDDRSRFSGGCGFKPTFSRPCLFMMQITVKEDAGTAYNSLRTVFDFIMEVVVDCTDAEILNGCNAAPSFSPKTIQGFNANVCTQADSSDAYCGFLRFVDTTYELVAVDRNVEQIVTINVGTMPRGSSFTFKERGIGPDQYDSNREKAYSIYNLRWEPAIDSVDGTACFQAQDNGSPARYSFGRFCVTMKIIEADFIYVSGLLRDFKVDHPDFGLTTANADNTASTPGVADAWILDTLDVSGKPILDSGASTTTVTQFQQWFNDVDGVNERVVFSIQLIQRNSALDRFEYSRDEFLPAYLQDAALGNDDTQGASGRDYNSFFTYEVHTYIAYNSGTNVPWEFSSSDDMWVFINGKLAADLGGIHAKTSATIDLSSQAERTRLGITAEEDAIYSCDIFFAHRSRARVPGPAIKLQLPKAVLCDALSTGVTRFDYDFTRQGSTDLNKFGAASNTATNKGVKLIEGTSNKASLYAAEGGGIPIQAKVLQGFEASFTFRVGDGAAGSVSPTEGFAFVMHSNAPASQGFVGYYLGYGGLPKSVAVEFDMSINDAVANVDTGLNYQHVAVHIPKDFVGANGPFDENLVEVSVYDENADPESLTNGPELSMDNNTAHNVRITYSPASEEGSAQTGWLRVYMNEVLRPIVEAPIDGKELASMLGSFAYVGFTAGSSAAAAPIYITDFTMTIVPAQATEMGFVNNVGPSNTRAGVQGSATIQARDACGNKILVGEDQALFSAVFIERETRRTLLIPEEIEYEFTTNLDGTYNILYTSKLAADLDVEIRYDGDLIDRAKRPTAQFTVSPGVPVAERSDLVFGLLTPSLNNAPGANCLFAAAYDPVSKTAESACYTVAGDVTAFLSANANKDYALAVVGSFTFSTAIRSALSAAGANRNTWTADDSWAFVHAANGQTVEDLEAERSTEELSLLSTSDVVIVSKSSGASALTPTGRGYINFLPTEVTFQAVETFPTEAEYPASTNFGEFYVIARDAFDNLASGAIQVSYAPQLAPQDFVDPIPTSDPGHYIVRFRSKSAGDYTVNAVLGGTNIQYLGAGTPAGIKVIAGKAVAANSVGNGGALFSSKAGSVSVFDLNLADIFGNPINTRANYLTNDVTVQFVNKANNALVITPTLSFGTKLEATYTPETLGPYNIVVTINGEEMTQTIGGTMVVGAGDVSLPDCTFAEDSSSVTSVAIANARAGEAKVFFIQLRDKFANKVALPLGSDPAVTFTESAKVEKISVQYQGGGLYQVSFTPIDAPNDLVMSVKSGADVVALLDGVTVPVVTGEESVMSTLSGGSATAVAGETIRYTVDCADIADNVIANCDETKFALALTTNGVTITGLNEIIQDGTSGKVTVDFAVEKAAAYSAALRLFGTQRDSNKDIAGSPKDLTIVPADTSAPDSTAEGLGLLGGPAGEPVKVFVQAKDEFLNNQVTGKGDTVVLTVNGATASSAPVVTGGDDGRWEITYGIPVATGNYDVVITINGAELGTFTAESGANAFVCNVPGDFASRADPSAIAAGDDLVYNVPYDEAADSFRVKLVGPLTVELSATQLTATSFEISESSSSFATAGTYEMIFFKNSFVECSGKKSLTVNPGAVDGFSSSVEGLRDAEAGEEQIFDVILRDAYGNTIGSGASVTAKFTPRGGGSAIDAGAAVFDATSDRYKVPVTISSTGVFDVVVTANGQNIGLPPAITISPGGPVATRSTTTCGSKGSYISGVSDTCLVTLLDAADNNIPLLDTNTYSVTGTFDGSAVDDVSYIGNGQFEVTFSPAVAGASRTLTLTLVGGTAAGTITGSDVTVNVLAGPVDPSSTVNEPTIAAGNDMVLTFVAEDAAGNSVTGKTIVAVATSPSGSSLPLPGATETPPGTYTITLPGANTELAGEYSFTYLVDNILLSDGSTSKKSAGTVTPGPFDLSNSQYEYIGFKKAGEAVSVKVAVRDEFGNALTEAVDVPAEQIRNVFVGLDQGAVTCDGIEDNDSVKYNAAGAFQGASVVSSPGQLTVNFTPLQIGSFLLTLYSTPDAPADVNVANISSTTPAAITCAQAGIVTVTPGDPDKPKSVVLVNPRFNLTSNDTSNQIIVDESVIAGETFQVVVNLRDVLENSILEPCLYIEELEFGGPAAASVSNALENTLAAALPACAEDSVNQLTSYSFDVRATTAGDFEVVVTGVMGNDVPERIGENVVTLTVLPAGPANFANVADPQASVGKPTDFTISGLDAFGNNLVTTDHTYIVTFSLAEEVNADGFTRVIYEAAAEVTPGTNGLHDVSILVAAAGDFDVKVDMYDKDGNFLASKDFTWTVLPQACPADKPIRCDKGKGDCAASHSDCADIVNKCSTNQFLCHDDTCVDSVTSCPCPDSAPTRCDLGQCVADASQCHTFIEGQCPELAPFACQTNGKFNGFCRQTAADCPSERVCPPGYKMCQDGATCITEEQDAATFCPVPVTCPQGTAACLGGSCAVYPEDCPTPVTCADGGVVCPDGTCAASASVCPTLYPCEDPATGAATFRCPDGSCSPSQDTCPVRATCPEGFVKCSSGQCALAVGDCGAEVDCAAQGKIRCSDGSCAGAQKNCGSVTTCATGYVQCSDRACVTNALDCSTPSSCPGKFCPDGSCVDSATACPTTVQCPSDSPVYCTDGACVADITECKQGSTCSGATPVRCPDGLCSGSIQNCATATTCPDSRPIKCADGYCTTDATQCSDITNLVCGQGEFRCFSGECVSSELFCTASVACPADNVRCEDGTCRTECSGVVPVGQCADDQIQCPQSSIGKSCADSLAACPPAPACPDSAPVKCFDNTCVRNVNNCPDFPADTTGVIPCPSGLFTPDGFCDTAVSCSDEAPFVCGDGSCVEVPDDCPVLEPCGTDSLGNALVRCGSSCVSNFNDNLCTVTSTGCRVGEVRCSNQQCANSTDFCPREKDCGDLQTCRDGSCSTECETLEEICASTGYLTFACPDGSCAEDEASCNSEEGCPADKPNRCRRNGVCVADATDCPDNVPDAGCSVAYAFGICCADAPDDRCASMLPNLCPPDKQIRCADKRCVDNAEACSSSVRDDSSNGDFSHPPNTCPSDRPFKCSNGFCAEASNKCPLLPGDFCANSTDGKTACADGTCVASSDFCSVVYPCAAGTQRCADGSCRSDDFVTAYGCDDLPSSCPDKYPFRCDDGLCAVEGQCLLTNGCPATLPSKCDDQGGVCSLDCTSVEVSSTDGCPSQGQTKCFYGECVDDPADCLSREGCDPATPFKCPDGSCVDAAGRSSCPAAATCPEFECSDGKCVADVAECLSASFCPVSTPYRCADGSCKEYPATAISAADDKKCLPQVVCFGGQVLCFDGSCQDSLIFCKPSAECPPSTVECSDKSCAATAGDCPPAKCPKSSPILCEGGECVSNGLNCPGTVTIKVISSTEPVEPGQPGPGEPNGPDVYDGVDTGCTSAKPKKCFDGGCRATLKDCIDWKIKVTNGDKDGGVGDSEAVSSESCGDGFELCADGSCAPFPVGYNPTAEDLDKAARGKNCPIIPRCPRDTTRTWNGDCLDEAAAALLPKDPGCPANTFRCEDGTCRDVCLHFNGCPLSKPFHCPNRECAVDSTLCEGVTPSDGYDKLRPRISRSLLQNDNETVPEEPEEEEEVLGDVCSSNCNAQVSALRLQFTVDPAEASEFVVGVSPVTNSPIAFLSVPSGAITSTATTTSLLIRPVADSIMLDAENTVHPSRRELFGERMTFAESLLSVPFECTIDDTATPEFALPLLYRAEVDSTRMPRTDLDVCLAWLVRIRSIGYARWQCVRENEDRRLVYPVEDGAANPYELESAVPDCGEPNQGKIYGFVHAPIPVLSVRPSPPKPTNILLVMMIILALVVVVILVFYFMKRLHRYRSKYIDERAAVREIKDEVDEMEQFGGTAGAKDDEVEMVSNPLVIQMKDMQRRLDEKQRQMAEEEVQAQVQQTEARREHIAALKTDRDDLASELERLKAQLAAQSAAPQATAQRQDAPVAASSQRSRPTPAAKTQFSAARPKKKKEF